MDTRAVSEHSGRVLVKMAGGTPLFSPTLPEKDSTGNEHSQTEGDGGNGITVLEAHKWVAESVPRRRSSALTW